MRLSGLPTRSQPAETARFWRTPGVWLIGVAALYLGLSAVYVSRLPLVMDEFQGARAVWRLTSEVPYRDFLPYKTVLGYYLQLPALMAVEDPWTALLVVKAWMALLAAGVLGTGAVLLARELRPGAVVAALGGALVMSDFLERSPDLRVDLPTALVAFLSFLALLRRRPGLAGVLAGLAFTVSQKAVYGLLAGAVAILAGELVERRYGLGRGMARYLGGAAATVGAYLVFWAAVAGSFSRVFRAVFLSHVDIALGELYPGIWSLFWGQTLGRNPLYWALAAVAVVVVAARAWRQGADRGRHATIASYGAAMLGLGAWHRQPWPYFFVLLVPTVFLLHATLLHLLAEQWKGESRRRLRMLACVVLALFGLVWPLLRIPVNLGRDSRQQAETVRMGHWLLPQGAPYLAGVDIIWRRHQSPAELAWLDQVRLRVIRKKTSDQLAPLIADLASQPPRIVIVNSRLEALPRPVLRALAEQYRILGGNILGYAPLVEPPGRTVVIPFPGRFRVEAELGGVIMVDGLPIHSGEYKDLGKGEVVVKTDGRARLLWSPERLDRVAGDRREPADLFPNVYSY